LEIIPVLDLRFVVNYKVRRDTKDQLFTRILEEIDKTEGRVGLASATSQEAAAFDVRLVDQTGSKQIDRTK
jgi:hypothetical protein